MQRVLIPLATAALLVAACGKPTASNPTAAVGAKTEQETAELAFLSEMVPHHAQAVSMAKPCLDRAGHAELKELCRDIVAAQENEIGEMKSWAKAWYGADLAETMPMGGHGGMQMNTDVTALLSSSGNDFDRRFLDMMTGHHEGAITSATAIKDKALHQEVRALAQAIVTSQQSEVQKMADWKRAWFA